MVGQSDIVRNPVRLRAEYTMLVGNVSGWRDFTLAVMSSKLRTLEVAYTRSVVMQLSRGLKHVLHRVYHGCVEVGVRPVSRGFSSTWSRHSVEKRQRIDETRS